MDQGRAEMGIPHRRGRRDLYNPSTRFQPVDPFTSSIAQVSRNRQNASGIDNINDVPLLPHPRGNPPRAPWATSNGRSQFVPSRFKQREDSRSSRHDLDLGPVRPTVPTTHPAFVCHPSTPNNSTPPRSPHVREDANDNSMNDSVHSPLNDPHIEGEISVNSRTSSQHDSLDSLKFSAPVSSGIGEEPSVKSSASSRHGSFDNIRFHERARFSPRLTPISPPPSGPPVRSHNNAGRRMARERLQEPDYLSGYPYPPRASPPPSPRFVERLTRPSIVEHSWKVSPATDVAIENINPSLLFATNILPRQVYLHLLLRLPSFYYSRVSQIFTEADLTLEEIQEMAIRVYTENKSLPHYNMFETEHFWRSGIPISSPAYEGLKSTWEHFIDNLIREWKTLNIISVLLLSAIMTMFQIHGAAEDPITRYLAFWSLICALMSLLYGCSYIVRFGSMRKAYKAVEWAIEAQKMHSILWNVWVMLAMPMVWMTWSILAFIASIMSFMWRAKANLASDFEFSVEHSTELGFRIFICVVLGLGAVYGTLVISTFRRYGTQMDETWMCRIEAFIESTDSRYRSTTLPATRRSRVDSRSITSLPWRVPAPVPTFYRSSKGDDASSPINSPLPYRSWYRKHPQRGLQSAKPSEIEELQQRRSKPTLSLSQLSIPNNRNGNKDILSEFPDQQLYRSSSPSCHSLSRHPIPSENNNINFASRWQLHLSASDNPICYSLEHHPIPVVEKPNDDNSSPPRPSYDCISSNCLPSATRHKEEIHVYSHPKQNGSLEFNCDF